MIYSLKMTEKNSKHKPYRIIQVDSNFVFYDLDEIVAIAFRYIDVGNYLFTMLTSNGKPCSNTYLGTPSDTNLKILDDEIIQLNELLQLPGDKVLYTVESDGLNFEIELIQIEQSNTNFSMPTCIEAQGHLDESENMVVDVDSINEDFLQFGRISEEFEKEYLEANEPNWATLIEQAMKLNTLKPWDYFKEHEIVAIQHPETDEVYFVSILGGAGEEFGVAAYVGYEGHKFLKKIVSREINDNSFLELSSLNLSYVNRDELDQEDYQLIKDAGFSFKGPKKWMQFRSYQPGQFPWLPDYDEVNTLIFLLQNIERLVEVRKNGWEYPILPEDIYPAIIYDVASSEWQIHIIEPLPPKNDEQIYVEITHFEQKQIEHKPLKPLNIEFDLFYMPYAVQDVDNIRPFFPLMAAAVDAASGLVLFQELIPIPNDPAITQTIFMQMLKSLTFQPTVIFVKEELAYDLKPIMDLLKLPFEIKTQLHELDQFKEYVRQLPIKP